jgi:phosphatidylglycerophosphate synthase
LLSDVSVPPAARRRGAATLADAEELPDFYIHRPVAARLVRLLLLTPITPNQVTLASGAAGVLAALALARSVDRPALRLACAALLFGSTVLDCCDGQLARARQMTSPNGMLLDAAADVVVGISMVVAATHVVAQASGSSALWLLAPVVLASYAVHCYLFDVVKEQFFAAHGLKYQSSKAEHAEQRAAAARQGAGAWLFDFYWRTAGPLIRPARNGSRVIDPLAMRVWTLVGQGTHMACLYIAAALSYAWLPALTVCLLVFAVAMNLVMAGLFAAGASPR